MKAETVRLYFFIALGVTFFGAALFLANVPKSHRWTFYESRWTGPEYRKWIFEASQLLFDADTKHQQRVYTWLFAHPDYHDKNTVKDWILKLKSDGEILGRGDKKLPKGCDSFSGHSLESFFTKSLQRFAYYGDVESTAQVEAHIKKLKQEVDERPLVDGLVGSAEEGKQEEDIEDGDGGGEDDNDDEELTEKLREALAARDEAVKELEAALDEAVKERTEKDVEIERLRKLVDESPSSSVEKSSFGRDHG